jgi:integrase
VKQHLAAIRMLCNYLVVPGVLRMNPAAAVRGPKHSAKRGKKPVLTGAEARAFLASIETDSVLGLRDRAVLGVMVYTFGRVGRTISRRRTSTRTSTPVGLREDRIGRSTGAGGPPAGGSPRRRVLDDQAADAGGGRANEHLLPYIPRERHHRLPGERWQAREGAADPLTRVAAHDEAL